MGNKVKKIKVSIMTLLLTMTFIGLPFVGAKAVTVPVPVVNVSSNQGYTNSQKPVIYGTSVAYGYITISIDGTAVPEMVTADAYGNFNYTPTATLAAGDHSITAKAQYSTTGDFSAVSSAAKVNIDLTAPVAPVIDTKINGIITNNQHPVIYGTAEANSRITINIDGTDYIDVATTDGTTGSGKWTYTVGAVLLPGDHTITAKAKDLAYNTGVASASVVITIDTTKPIPPVITKPIGGTVSKSNAAGIISGTADPNTSISVKIDNAELIDIVKADNYGMWTFTPTITYNEGNHTIYAKAKDAAGNISDYSAVCPFTIDTTVPSAPAVTKPLGDTITNNQRPVIVGTAEPNSNVLVNIDGKDIQGANKVDSLGNWSYVPANNLSDGVHKYVVKISDAAENVSSDRSFSITIDSVKPDAPVIISPTSESTVLQRVTVTGTGEPNGTILLRADTTKVDDVINIDKDGKWKYTFGSDLVKGFHRIYAKTMDLAGNMSDETQITFKTVVAFPIIKPVILKPSNNIVSKNAKLVISGTGEPNAKITVLVDGKALTDVATVDASGNFTVRTSTPFVDGAYELTVQATSSIYKTDTISDPINIEIDTVAPSTPTVVSPVNKGKIVGNRLFVTGMADPDSIIYLMIDNKAGKTYTYKTKASTLGSWSIKPSNAFLYGNYLIAVEARDDANNISKISSFINVTFKKK